MDGWALVAQAHGDALRMLCQACHPQGLSAAARRVSVSQVWKQKLRRIDTAFHVTHHITRASAATFDRSFEVSSNVAPASSMLRSLLRATR